MPAETNPNFPGFEKTIALTSLLGLAAVAWLYLWQEAARMSNMSMASAIEVQTVTGNYLEWLIPTFIMWTIMMIGMMLPSAAPAMLLYGGMARKHRERGSMLPSLWVFAAGYLAVWTGFSLAATVIQGMLRAYDLITATLVSNNTWLTALLLIVAGVYQWLPAKEACLNKCRDPLQFFLFRWHPGAFGAFRMGAEHGAFCIGCCWALMLLLFTAGVMNLLWVALIAGYVLIEKLLPAGRWTGRLAGFAMVVAGATVAVVS